ncbi:carbamoyl-phosphate synthase (glutamine-hydrolyzing) large subunit [Evansella cellulosilytica]|uniref:Carbamoyl phosphate synthase large chain n=1 Tax=Evansella cellulosilytica (strain ATCC 21833 / DSM 2522 / FERM P-1141 / JCM 9156 / N-4) TaxID=649639 RepID=E6TYY4_EVAC2|nr:carbamoyl-phosphate synthase (glutamine-hydrolyzing) large subunit [Evansella cellulosilytica]ADU32427.1 carbamoyl-phosphate synthase, large subunit [Evansella cellulosilytica DSM 2522]
MPKHNNLSKVLVIGSGPIVIGQAAEFDYAGTQACLALKEEGIEVVLVNNNPATIMTDQSVADQVYIEPLNIETIEKIIKIENPDGMIGTLGGQTGLNLTVELYESGILDKYDVTLLGTSVQSIQKGEDREKFRNLMLEIGEPIPESSIIEDMESGFHFVKEIGYPVIIRPAYTLGGAGGGFATNDEELEAILKQGLTLSPIHQVLIEKSIKGWKEVEYEVMRDENDTCTIVCNMENMDPVGVHTGDSIVVAPSQTLSDVQYQMLRDSSLKVIRALNVVGGCNIQFALEPQSNQYYIIEVNPRVSRSSALASKATGYPIARIATKCAIGYHLDEILNPITGNTYASFEPAIDYIVAKLPRFPFDKFSEGDRSLGTQMKATGEVMAIDRSFEGALNKALRSMEMKAHSLYLPAVRNKTSEEIEALLIKPTDLRLFAIAEAFRRGYTIEQIAMLTEIDRWFLTKVKNIVTCESELATYQWEIVPDELIKKAKHLNVGDKRIAEIFSITEKEVRQKLKQLHVKRGYKLVDTCAAEFDAITPYYYSTYRGADEVETSTNKKKVLVIGSGPIRIGQGIEFDYCSVHAAKAVKKKGYEAIVMNNNPETVSTDYSIADRLYFEPLALEDILAVVEKEKVEGVLVQFGGQTAINLANELEAEGVKVLGTSNEVIDKLEDREQFYALLNDLDIPHIAGKTISNPDQLLKSANELEYPVLIRPSYVIGGQSMFICYNDYELNKYLHRIIEDGSERSWPLLVDKYLPGLECEIDVISDGESIVVPGIFEHLEKAGVHSGDSVALFPPITIGEHTKEMVIKYGERIAKALPIVGMMNIQYVVHDETVYVLEVNPRSSRTVPIMSKVTGVPMIEWATNVQLGDSLTDLSEVLGLLQEPQYYSVKAPIFSASKLKGVDHVLGPEMKSTGETLGLGLTIEEAFSKALALNNVNKNEDNKVLFCSISDRAKDESVAYIQSFVKNGYAIIGTEGTVTFLQEKGIHAEAINKEKVLLHDFWKKTTPTIVLNIPNEGRDGEKIGFYIRELAVRYQVPYFTSNDTLKPWIDAFEQKETIEIPRTLGDYLAYIKNGNEEVPLCQLQKN